MPARKTTAPDSVARLDSPASRGKQTRKVGAAVSSRQRVKKSDATAVPSAPPTAVPTDAARKPHKQREKLVRDSFTMPKADFALIALLKERALAARREARKSELLRAGLHVLMALDGSALVAALEGLQSLKVGRPKKGH